MAVFNPKSVAKLLLQEYRRFANDQYTAHDHEMKEKIVDLINAYLNGAVEEHETLDAYDGANDDNDDGLINTDDEDADEEDADFVPEEESPDRTDKYPGTEKKREIIHYWNGQTKRPSSIKSVQARYRYIADRTTLYRWEKMLQQGL